MFPLDKVKLKAMILEKGIKLIEIEKRMRNRKKKKKKMKQMYCLDEYNRKEESFLYICLLSSVKIERNKFGKAR